MNDPSVKSAQPDTRSLAVIAVAWAILQIGGLFSPGLLDDVDSIYIEIAREMLHRRDFVTPYIDGIRFFDKPPLMYWLAAGSMRLFGEFDWAARLPLALSVLALLFAVYTLGLRLFQSERAAFYSSLALATAIGPYLYTRFFIPDILICLWMTLSVHCFLIALDRIPSTHHERSGAPSIASLAMGGNGSRKPSALLPCLLFAATLALNLLTKGLIGIVFPIGFVLLYLALTRQLRLLFKFHPISSTLVFLAIALPWHILAAIRNPAIAMPSGLGLPAKAGWAWFYLYNEHFARFLGKRIPHDYGQTPIWLFWLYAFIWIFPWAVFLPAAIAQLIQTRKLWVPYPREARVGSSEAALTTTLWPLLVLVFFTLSSRQEYYSLPALPALALMAGALLASADEQISRAPSIAPFAMGGFATKSAIACHRWLLLPITSLVGVTCAFFAIVAPHPQPGVDLSALLSNNPELYNLSLGHIFDLKTDAMGFFRGPLIAVAVGMAILGPISYGLRRYRRTFAANLMLASGMIVTLLAAHEGLVRFYPILGSKELALGIVDAQQQNPQPNDLILIDGELTAGSTLLFYTRQPVDLVNGRVNGPWFGSFWPDAPPIFEDEASLRRLWQSPQRLFLLTDTPASRTTALESFGPVHVIASAGGKSILVNR
jgi:4-amino-4-deoxy-L-arabinose transferase-like glycosyltransferase